MFVFPPPIPTPPSIIPFKTGIEVWSLTEGEGGREQNVCQNKVPQGYGFESGCYLIFFIGISTMAQALDQLLTEMSTRNIS